jgi:aminoglycoside phosphotransferase (APT) family kinase protein
VLRHWDEHTLGDLLAAHGLTGAVEAPFANDGWSGATLTRLVRPGDRAAFVLKRTSWSVDWIARSTRDHALREGFVAAMPLPLPAPLVAPYHGAAADGTTLAILMPDLAGRLLAWDLGGAPDPRMSAGLPRVMDALARLHAAPWPIADATDGFHRWPSAPLAERLLLLGPTSARRLADGGVAAGRRFLSGWAAFERLAPPKAMELVRRLDADPAPLLDALARLPATGLHGDLKLGNVALLDDGRVALIDWQMTMLAPVCVELGWLLVANSGVLPERPEVMLDDYRHAVEAVAGTPIAAGAPYDGRRRFPEAGLAAVFGTEPTGAFRTRDQVLGDWAAQVDMAWVVGLVLRGWRKGLDAEAGVRLPSGVSAADDLTAWCRRALGAVRRRL